MDLVDVAGADDDLELASVKEATLEVFVVVDCRLVDLCPGSSRRGEGGLRSVRLQRCCRHH